MKVEHPSYPNPTVIEVLCEIHFVPAAELSWSSTQPMPVYRLVEDAFPTMEILPETQLSFEFSPSGPTHKTTSSGQRLRFKNADETKFIQISAAGDIVVFNILDPYPGWSDVKLLIKHYWNALKDVLHPETITQISLRYINRVPYSKELPRISDWIHANETISEMILRSQPGSALRVEIIADECNSLYQTIRNVRPSADEPYGSTVVDTDHVWINTHAEKANVEETLEKLHEKSWISFSSALTEQYISLLSSAEARTGR